MKTRVFTFLVTALASLSAFGWGAGHETVARATLRSLPGIWGERLRDEAVSRLFVASSHAPDDQRTRLSERAQYLDGELRAALANPDGPEPVMYAFHSAAARALTIRALARAIRRDDTPSVAYLLAVFNHSVADTVSANHSPLLQLITYHWRPLGLQGEIMDDCSALERTEGGRSILERACARPFSCPTDPPTVDDAAYADEWHGLDFFRYDRDLAAGGTPCLEALAAEAAYAVHRTVAALAAAEAFAAVPEIPSFDAAAAERRAAEASHRYLAGRPLTEDALTAGLVSAPGIVPEIGVVYDPTGFWTRGLVYMANRAFAAQIATTLVRKHSAGLLDIRTLMAEGVPSGVKTVVMPGSGFAGDWHGFVAADLVKALQAFLSRGGKLVWIGGDPLPPAALFPEAKDFLKNPVPNRWAEMRGSFAADDMVGGALVLPEDRRFRCVRAPKGPAGWYWQQLASAYLVPNPLPPGAERLLEFETASGARTILGYTLSNRTFIPAFALFPYVFTDERPSLHPLKLELDAAGAALIERAL